MTTTLTTKETGGPVQAVVRLHDSFFGHLARVAGDWFLPTLARFAFAAVLLGYFWSSALTKIDLESFGLSTGAYFSILGEATLVNYDFEPANVPFWLKLVVLAGTFGEFVLPLMIVFGLFTRVAALGMIIFVAVQTFVDIAVHGVDASAIGAWFDRDSASAIFDQRTLWFLLLATLVTRGAGPLSLDRLLTKDR